MFRASQFLAEELPIRLAHRVEELGELPDGLGDMESIKNVRNWYAQSFEVSSYLLLTYFGPKFSPSLKELTSLAPPSLSSETKERLLKSGKEGRRLSTSTQNPSLQSKSGGDKSPAAKRSYFAPTDTGGEWPRQLKDYNKTFTAALDKIKKRHDGVVTTVGVCFACYYVQEINWRLMLCSYSPRYQ